MKTLRLRTVYSEPYGQNFDWPLRNLIRQSTSWLWRITNSGASTYLILTDISSKFAPVDRPNTGAPVLTLSGANDSGGVAFASGAEDTNYLYAILYKTATGKALRIIDVTTPTNPTVVGGTTLDLPPYAWGGVVSGNYLYMIFRSPGTDTNKLRIIDISNKTAPAIVGGTAVTLPDNPQSVFLDAVAHRLYIGFESGQPNSVRIVDVTNPASPSVLDPAGHAVAREPRGLAKVGQYLYSGGTVGSLIQWDVTDPVNIVERTRLVLTDGLGEFDDAAITPDGQTLIAGAHPAGMQQLVVVDLTNPAGFATAPYTVVPINPSSSTLVNTVTIMPDGTTVYIGLRPSQIAVYDLINIPSNRLLWESSNNFLTENP